jgi:probable rRNA maturation factor
MTKQMIRISTNHPFLRFADKDAIRTLQHVYGGEGKKISALAVVFTHNRFIRRINREFLSRNTATDVMAFPLEDEDGVESEIYINLDAAREQAVRFGVTFGDEVKRLLIHGALHLLGYNDDTAKNREAMSAQEDFYLNAAKHRRKRRLV